MGRGKTRSARAGTAGLGVVAAMVSLFLEVLPIRPASADEWCTVDPPVHVRVDGQRM